MERMEHVHKSMTSEELAAADISMTVVLDNVIAPKTFRDFIAIGITNYEENQQIEVMSTAKITDIISTIEELFKVVVGQINAMNDEEQKFMSSMATLSLVSVLMAESGKLHE